MEPPFKKAQRILKHATRVVASGPRAGAMRKAAFFLLPALVVGMAGAATPDTRGPIQEVSIHLGTPHLKTTHEARQWSEGVMAQAGSATGVGAAGQVNAEDMLTAWIQSGITPAQAMELLNVLMLTQSPMWAEDPGVLEKNRQLAQRARGIWKLKSHQQAEEFLQEHAVVALYQEGWLDESEVMNTLGGEGANWEDVVAYWARWSSQRLDEPIHRPRKGAAQEMETAMAKIERAAKATGLASLRVPVASWDSPRSLEKIAQRILTVNQSLGSVSGMQGPSLGLNGRVHLTVTAPRGMGVAWADGENIHIHATWEDLPHEWIHGLDMALKQSWARDRASADLLVEPDHSSRPRWHDLPGHLERSEVEHGHDWMKGRLERVSRLSQGNEEERWKATYLMETQELVAFQWQSYFQLHIDPSHPSFDALSHDGVAAPLAQQSRDASEIWQSALADVKRHWWDTQVGSEPTQPSQRPRMTP